jgi:hypothetical protein
VSPTHTEGLLLSFQRAAVNSRRHNLGHFTRALSCLSTIHLDLGVSARLREPTRLLAYQWRFLPPGLCVRVLSVSGGRCDIARGVAGGEGEAWATHFQTGAVELLQYEEDWAGPDHGLNVRPFKLSWADSQRPHGIWQD